MTHARSLQTRLARAEAERRDACAALHRSRCQKLGLPETATERQVIDAFARSLTDSVHRYERAHGLLPRMRPVTLGDDLRGTDDMTLLAHIKATLRRDGYLPQEEADAEGDAL